jgi:putative sterol carrier protein
MADTREFFETYLPEKFGKNPNLAATVKAVIQFDIDGAGSWVVDLAAPPGAVREGTAESPSCVITVAKADWEKVLDQPSYAMQAFMTGKLKATNIGVAMQLQKILA